MMLRILLTALLIWNVIPMTSVHAQDNTQSACLQSVYDGMAAEERIFRSVIFGQKKSKDLPLGSVRFDRTFNGWMKVGNNSWKTLTEGEGSRTIADAQMDETADAQARRGILEIRETPTSDLIPPILQATRALQCRLNNLCKLATMSRSENKEGPLKINVDGCAEVELPALKGCTETISVADVSLSSCDAAVNAIMEREAKLLHLAITYDAAYRSLLQFAGTFDGFLSDFRLPLLQPLWQAVRALGALNGIPCFLSQCDL